MNIREQWRQRLPWSHTPHIFVLFGLRDRQWQKLTDWAIHSLVPQLDKDVFMKFISFCNPLHVWLGFNVLTCLLHHSSPAGASEPSLSSCSCLYTHAVTLSDHRVEAVFSSNSSFIRSPAPPPRNYGEKPTTQLSSRLLLRFCYTLNKSTQH